MSPNPQAETLNHTLQSQNPVIFDLLSEKGRAIFWPKEGILKQSAEAKGKKINATVGIATEHGNPMCLDSLKKQVPLEMCDCLPYAPSFGRKDLRELWKEKIHEKNPSLQGTTTLPIVTGGLTHGLTTVAYLFFNEGDEIILPDKFWGNYKLIFQNGFGAKFNTYETFVDGAFNTKGLKKKITEGGIGKKIVFLNIPNNPTGYSPTTDEYDAIVKILKDAAEAGNKLLVICDDAYFGLVYEEGIARESLFAQVANLHSNILAVKVDGCTKEEYVWGLRVAFLSFATQNLTDESADALEQKTAGAIRGTVSNCCHLSQSLMLRTLQSPTYQAEKQKNFEILQERYRVTKEVLSNNKEKYETCFSPLPFNSGYFMCVELKNLEGENLRQILLQEFDTGVIAMGNLLRIAFSSLDKEQIEPLFENIYLACEKVSPSS